MSISKISFTHNPYAEYERRMAELCRSRFHGTKPNQPKGTFEDFKKEFDDKIFTFEDEKGKVFKGTIKEFLEDSIANVRRIENGDKTMYHATTSRDVAMDIIKDGLDWKRTNRMRCGPGTYFAPCAEEARMQVGTGIILEGVYRGDKKTYPVLKSKYYDSIEKNKELRELAKEYNLGIGAVNEYCHDLMQHDMGIDFFYSSPGYGGAYVVVNNDCLSLSTYGW